MAVSRRRFIQGSAAVVGGLAADSAEPSVAEEKLGRRTLGRTTEKVSVIGFGTAPLGSDNSTPEESDRILRTALDTGINYFDTAPVYGDVKSRYGNAEGKMKSFLARHRKQVFLVTKVNAERPDRDGVLRQLEESMKRMGVDQVDAVHIHNLGDFDMKQTLGKDGALAGLRKARKREWIRFIGASGHMRPARFVEAIETGEIDLTMNALNFADRVNYDFEGLVIPAAKKKGTAVVAMKVLGGAAKWAYDGKSPGCFVDQYESAIRYSLGIAGVCSAVIGFSNVEEVKRAVDVARRYNPLDPASRQELLAQGRKLAAVRGLYYGPATG